MGDDLMSNANKTLVTVATYNEIENLPRLVGEIFAHAPDVDLLAIDDNSPDGTADWCLAQSAIDSRVHCLRRSGKLGLGSAIVAGMQYGIEHGYKYVLNMDADFSHHPRHVPALIAEMERDGGPPLDVMIGSRYVAGGRIEGWPLKRHLMSRGVNLYARWLLWLEPRDCSGGYRCYRVSALRGLDFSQIRSRGYSFQEEVLWRLRRQGASFGETPIQFADRVHGHSKIDAGEAVAALRIIVQLGISNLFGRK